MVNKEKWTIQTVPWIGQSQHGQRVLSARKEHGKKFSAAQLSLLPQEVLDMFDVRPTDGSNKLFTVQFYTSNKALDAILAESEAQDAQVTRRGLFTYITATVEFHKPDDPDLEYEAEPTKTDPYGKLSYCIGNDDDFVCFDYFIRDDGKVIIHSAVNSETGSFLDRFDKAVVPIDQAVAEAERQIDLAWEWCFELNHVTGKRDAKRFLHDLKADIRRRIRL